MGQEDSTAWAEKQGAAYSLLANKCGTPGTPRLGLSKTLGQVIHLSQTPLPPLYYDGGTCPAHRVSTHAFKRHLLSFYTNHFYGVLPGNCAQQWGGRGEQSDAYLPS